MLWNAGETNLLCLRVHLRTRNPPYKARHTLCFPLIHLHYLPWRPRPTSTYSPLANNAPTNHASSSTSCRSNASTARARSARNTLWSLPTNVPKYDETKYNRVSPNCPLCNVVVSVRPGQDANEAVETHFVRDCAVMTGKAKAKTTPICARARCGKALFAPIRCTVHMQPTILPRPSFPRGSTPAPLRRKPRLPGPQPPAASSTSMRRPPLPAAAALGAIKTMASNAQSQASSSSSRPAAAPAAKAPAAAAPSKPNLFSKTKTDRYFSSYPSSPIRKLSNDDTKPSNDATSTTAAPADNINADETTTTNTKLIRARAERESRRKAMQERAKKGLLSEEEKLALAREEAELAQEDKKECVVM
ncbi:Chorismate mutase [Mycena venus]|uniref:Chorismate mutase n=1 Tax=Mycena venus TaxID=2733690 RepID=A0A8H6YQ39_9AGAR|nr:Chorismate mutase [Mycena venus]